MAKVHLVDGAEVFSVKWTVDDAIPIRNRRLVALRAHVPTNDEWPDIHQSHLPRSRSILLALKREDALALAVALYQATQRPD